jgi:hypothetical protein
MISWSILLTIASRVNIKNDLAAETLHTVFRTIKLFYENIDLETTSTAAQINWRRISKGLPKARTRLTIELTL